MTQPETELEELEDLEELEEEETASSPWVGDFRGELAGDPMIVAEQGISVTVSVDQPDGFTEPILWVAHPDSGGLDFRFLTDTWFFLPNDDPSEPALADLGGNGSAIFGYPDGTAEWGVDSALQTVSSRTFLDCPAETVPSAAAKDVVLGADGLVESFTITHFELADFPEPGADSCAIYAIIGYDIAFARVG